MILDKEGNVYSTNYIGGADKKGGTVWKVTPSGAFTLLYNFKLDGQDGYGPDAGVVMDEKENFYGTTRNGGA